MRLQTPICANLSDWPNVFTIDDFLTDAENKHLLEVIKSRKKKFKASFTEDESLASHVNTERTSTFIYLKKAENNIELIIVDYLQLMSGPKGSESRQQEISQISRSLKN